MRIPIGQLATTCGSIERWSFFGTVIWIPGKVRLPAAELVAERYGGCRTSPTCELPLCFRGESGRQTGIWPTDCLPSGLILPRCWRVSRREFIESSRQNETVTHSQLGRVFNFVDRAAFDVRDIVDAVAEMPHAAIDNPTFLLLPRLT